MATHSSVLAWRIPGMGSLVGCCLWGHTESDTTEATQQQQQHATDRKRKWYKYTEKHLNHIPYDYTVEVTNRFKGLDLVDRVPEELWMENCNIVQKAVTKTIPKEKKCKKAKWLPGEAL